MKRVMVSGSYDYLHYGHLRLLKRARELGDYLIVMLSTDEFNKEKGKQTHMTYDERKQILEELRCVDLVVPESSHDQKKEYAEKYKVDIYAVGNDWAGSVEWLEDYGVKVVIFPRTEGISSTQIKESLK